MVSYADFITLLFAFFVVMYSLSSVNEGKYKILSDSLVSAFRNVTINESGEQVVMPPIVPPVIHRSAPPQSPEAEVRREQQVRQVRNMADEIRRVLEPLSRTGQVTVTEGAHGISVEINASVLFASGEAALGPAATAPLRAVASVLAGADFPVKVEGHTDDTPINTFRFPSNWELSSARASSVVRLFIDAGVDPATLTAAGYSDQRPIGDNATPEGRARNRRVTILIESMFEAPDAPSGAGAGRDFEAFEPLPAEPVPLQPDDPILSILPERGPDAAEEALSVPALPQEGGFTPDPAGRVPGAFAPGSLPAAVQ